MINTMFLAVIAASPIVLLTLAWAVHPAFAIFAAMCWIGSIVQEIQREGE